MKLEKLSSLTATVLFLGVNSVNAATYTSLPTDTPFDVTLNTGSYAWQNEYANLSSSTSTYDSAHVSTSAPVVLDPVITPAQVGIPGSIDIYTQTVTTTTTYTDTTQQASAYYSADLNGPQTVPSSYSMSGSIDKNIAGFLIDSGTGYLDFNMGMNIGFDDPYTTDSVNGMLTFMVGSTPGTWSYTFQTEFSSLSNNISLADSLWLDFDDSIYFSAIYDINGAGGTPFYLNDLSLNVYGDIYDHTHTGSTSVNNDVLISSTEIPALTAIPVPAAVWLFGSGLIALTGLARRRSIA